MPSPVHFPALYEQYFYNMANEFVSIGEMMQHMNNGLPFSMVYVTYDKTSGKGGAVKIVDQATKCWPKNVDHDEEKAKDTRDAKRQVTNPNHFQNSTTNIRISAAGHADIRKVHIQLIRRFNGAIVK